MDAHDKAIYRIIQMIDWRKIKSFHKKLGIQWEINYDKEIIRRTPNVGELKDELKSILNHVKDEKLKYISYGNWVVFWDQENGGVGDIRVMFRIADFHFEENTESKESLEAALEKAIKEENYEYAAILRDTINKKEE